MDDDDVREVLYRVDERTELIQENVAEVKEINKNQRQAINRNRKMASDNRQILNVLTLGIGSVFSAVMAKLAGLIRF